MTERSLSLELAHDTGPCREGWHLRHTVEGEPVYFQRAGHGRGFAYVFALAPDGKRTKLVKCAPNEGPWLCEACWTFIATESCHLADSRPAESSDP